MNDIDLLRRYGPDTRTAGGPALATARDRLMAEAAHAPAARPRRLARRTGAAPGRRSRRGMLAATAAVGVLAAAGIGAATGLGPSAMRGTEHPPSRGGISLVAFDMPEFPLALRPVPSGLAAPVYTGDPEPGGGMRIIAVHLSRSQRDDVYLSVSPRRGELGRPVMVNGKPGMVSIHDPDGGPAVATVTWQRRPGQWVSVTGNGRFATREAVLGLARTVVEAPQQIPLEVRLAPAGWALVGFKDGTILTLQDTRSGGGRDTLSVQLVDKPERDLLHQVMGARTVTEVQVGGRTAQLVKADEIWLLQVPLPDGSAFNLQAPPYFTPEQVIAIAEQVRVNRPARR